MTLKLLFMKIVLDQLQTVALETKATSACSIDANELKSFISIPSLMPSNMVQSVSFSEHLQQPPGISSYTVSRSFEDDVISCCKSVTSNAIRFDQIHPKFIRLLLPKISRYKGPSISWFQKYGNRNSTSIKLSCEPNLFLFS